MPGPPLDWQTYVEVGAADCAGLLLLGDTPEEQRTLAEAIGRPRTRPP